jgi:alkaline phosphatase
LEEWKKDKIARNVSYEYVWNREQLMNLSMSPPDYLLGLFEGSHMQYHLEADEVTEPTLADLTEVAIRSLSRNKNGFFLFVEGGRIDHAHHDNYVHLALDETVQMSLAVQRAVELLPAEDTLVVVTADHAHVMAYNGYTHRGSDILGPSDDIGDDGVPYMTLSYTNGPGARSQPNGVRVNILEDDIYGM